MEVIGPHASGAGVIVAENGQVLTSVDFVGLNDARVRIGTALFPAKVLIATADLQIALVGVDPPSHFPAVAVDSSAFLKKGNWIFGIRRSKNGALIPVLGKVTRSADQRNPFLEGDFSLPEGSPLFDARGRLVAVAVRPVRRRLRALPIAAVKSQLAGATPQ